MGLGFRLQAYHVVLLFGPHYSLLLQCLGYPMCIYMLHEKTCTRRAGEVISSLYKASGRITYMILFGW